MLIDNVLILLNIYFSAYNGLNSHVIYIYRPLSKSVQFTKIKSFLRVACVAHLVWRMMKSRHYRDRASIARSSWQKRPARYTRSMLSGVSRPTIAHKTRLWARVGIVIQSQINLPAIPRGHDKKISLPRFVPWISAIRRYIPALAY